MDKEARPSNPALPRLSLMPPGIGSKLDHWFRGQVHATPGPPQSFSMGVLGKLDPALHHLVMHEAYQQGVHPDLLLARMRERAHPKDPIKQAAMTPYDCYMAKTAKTIFLGGTVSGPDAMWREGIKNRLRDLGWKVNDPRKPFAKWNPLKDIYSELGKMLAADKVVFYRGGMFSDREKRVLDRAGKPYEILKAPEDAVKKARVAPRLPAAAGDPRTPLTSQLPSVLRGARP